MDQVGELLDRIDEVTAGCMGCPNDVPDDGPSDVFCSPGCQTVALASMGDPLPGERRVEFIFDETHHFVAETRPCTGCPTSGPVIDPMIYDNRHWVDFGPAGGVMVER